MGRAGGLEIASYYSEWIPFKTYDLFISDVLFNVFGLLLTTGNKLWKAKPQVRGDFCTVIPAFL